MWDGAVTRAEAEAIECNVCGAQPGEHCTDMYNPRRRLRRWHQQRAYAVMRLAEHRPPECEGNTGMLTAGPAETVLRGGIKLHVIHRRMFTCERVAGSPRMSIEACAGRHQGAVKMTPRWGAKAPAEWVASIKICRTCPVGKAHRKGQDADGVEYREVGCG